MGKLRKRTAGGLTLHDLGHLLPDGTDLRRAGVGGLLDLIGASLSEGDGEQAKEVVIGRLHGDIGLDQRLPLANKGPQLVGREVQAVEVGEAVLALDFIHAEFNLAEGMVLVVLQVSERNLEDSALQGVVRIPQAAGAVHQSLADALCFVSTPWKCAMSNSRGSSYSRVWKVEGACLSLEVHHGNLPPVLTFTEYSSFLEKGSTVLFLIPFLPLERRLFLKEVNQPRLFIPSNE